ncbi:Hypp8274 [Branchiostoma lanceolatum]|uniref:Hypp8274 protein n=1 Tax=Branchiostoma lanceolatum TaxID=7740 RepID=A0A8K0EH26_BRALA|nr:Hypp8274 [Branchiostoma lanceolatum]
MKSLLAVQRPARNAQPGSPHLTSKPGQGKDEPKDLDLELANDYVPDDFLIGDIEVEMGRNQKKARHLIFATPYQLKKLSEARRLYLDGTFKVVRKPFYQLFSIHAFLRSGDYIKQVWRPGRDQSGTKGTGMYGPVEVTITSLAKQVISRYRGKSQVVVTDSRPFKLNYNSSREKVAVSFF